MSAGFLRPVRPSACQVPASVCLRTQLGVCGGVQASLASRIASARAAGILALRAPKPRGPFVPDIRLEELPANFWGRGCRVRAGHTCLSTVHGGSRTGRHEQAGLTSPEKDSVVFATGSWRRWNY